MANKNKTHHSVLHSKLSSRAPPCEQRVAHYLLSASSHSWQPRAGAVLLKAPRWAPYSCIFLKCPRNSALLMYSLSEPSTGRASVAGDVLLQHELSELHLLRIFRVHAAATTAPKARRLLDCPDSRA